jgi:hypothetical protein
MNSAGREGKKTGRPPPVRSSLSAWRSRRADGPRRPPEGKKRSIKKVWFYEIQNDGYDPDKIQGGGRPETPERNDIPGLLRAWKEYKGAGFTKPPGLESS